MTQAKLTACRLRLLEIETQIKELAELDKITGEKIKTLEGKDNTLAQGIYLMGLYKESIQLKGRRLFKLDEKQAVIYQIEQLQNELLTIKL